MNITLLQIGKTKHPFFAEAEKEYAKRLGPYVKLDVVTLKEAELPKGDIDAGRKWVKEKEGKEILTRVDLRAGDVVLALDEKGKEYTSLSFARLLDSFRDSGTPDLTFIIGGCYGLADEVLQKAHRKIALSQLT
ncbi:MAG TPA: 23S rRNA (pseudouridine(1915)-N(3))-methyltransferase RlmH, partial [Candidatus Gracilibacteria bacterium]|nr:23S rRNA (pseudouridine(1915)-N(3))-methyltransferase RlmH [Candidatus Gracilibacteria bacterium]